MANIFYISAGLPPKDNGTGATANTAYISAGLIPTDVSGAIELIANCSTASNTTTVELTTGTTTRELTAACSSASTTSTATAHFELKLVSPVDNDPSEAVPVTMSWSSYPGASNYNLQVSDDAGFSNIVTNIWTTQLSYEDSSLLDLTEYFWRVRAAA